MEHIIIDLLLAMFLVATFIVTVVMFWTGPGFNYKYDKDDEWP